MIRIYVLPEFSDGRGEVRTSAGAGCLDGLVTDVKVRPAAGRVPRVLARRPRQLGGHRRHEVVDRPRQHDDVEHVQPGRRDQRAVSHACTQANPIHIRPGNDNDVMDVMPVSHCP